MSHAGKGGCRATRKPSWGPSSSKAPTGDHGTLESWEAAAKSGGPSARPCPAAPNSHLSLRVPPAQPGTAIYPEFMALRAMWVWLCTRLSLCLFPHLSKGAHSITHLMSIRGGVTCKGSAAGIARAGIDCQLHLPTHLSPPRVAHAKPWARATASPPGRHP